MATVLIVENGSTVETSLPPPPENFPTSAAEDNLVPDKFYIKTKKTEASYK